MSITNSLTRFHALAWEREKGEFRAAGATRSAFPRWRVGTRKPLIFGININYSFPHTSVKMQEVSSIWIKVIV
jgi:hypothetical protein